MRYRDRPENRLCTGHRASRPEKYVCSVCKKERHRIEMSRTRDICLECIFKEEENINEHSFE